MNVGIGVAYMSRLGMDIPRKEPLGNVQNCVLDSGFGLRCLNVFLSTEFPQFVFLVSGLLG